VNEVLDIALFVADEFDRLGIRHVVAGSLASSFHGIPRTTQDVDFVADLGLGDVEPLVTALTGAFYVDSGAIREAIRDGTRFNAIHLETMFKVDVYIHGQDPSRRAQLDRGAGYLVSEDPERTLVLASAEDTIAHKLHWYRLGDEVSERQWKDALGIIRVQGDALDLVYLHQAAAALGVEDLLSQALAVGRDQEPRS